MNDQRFAGCSLTWWGHATTTVQIEGISILTDPVLTHRLAHLGRPAGLVPDARARRADVVLISHLHADHLHLPSLRLLPHGTPVIAPAGSRRVISHARGLTERLDEVDVGDTVDVGGLTIRAVPAAHDGRRHPVSNIRGPALGYLIDGCHSRVWFAGDTGLFDEMADVGPVDLAIVPVGGWGPTLGPDHLDPARAAEAVRRVRARRAVPIHYGTLWPVGMRRLHRRSFRRLFEQPGRQFAEQMAFTDPSVQVHVLDVGETIDWRVE